MDRLVVDLTCPRCGGHLLHDGFESKISAPDLGSVDARCDFCLCVFRVSVSIGLVESWPIDRCDPEARRAEAANAAALMEATSF